MTTPTPTPLRSDVRDLCFALTQAQKTAVRNALTEAVLALFDTATAQPTSDTNGSAPEDVDAQLSICINGLDPEGRP